MSAQQLPKAIYIDALALVPARKSGVGLSFEETLKNLVVRPEIMSDYQIYLVVPLGKAKYLQAYLGNGIHTKTIYLPARLLELLLRIKLFPPVDWLLGSGVYVFPNYRNWPLWRSRSLTYVYDVGFVRFPDTVQPKNRHYLQRYMRRWVSRADKVITITNRLKHEVERYLHLPPAKIAVVYCGVDTKLFFKRSANEIASVRDKYNIPYERYLLFVGNIEPRKNLVALLEAYMQLPEKTRQEYGLVLVGGDGWLSEAFYERLQQLQAAGAQILKVASYVETADLPALYSGATALVHPAVYEGFGITPLEAMACETPVIVADIDAIREVVQDTGYYFDPYSSTSITAAIKQMLQDSPDKLKQRIKTGANRAAELSWNQSAEQLSDLIIEQHGQGSEQKPLLKRLKYRYEGIDRGIRSLLGEKAQEPYRPAEAHTNAELQKIIIADFLREQPSHLQALLLGGYLRAKHVAATSLRVLLRMARASS